MRQIQIKFNLILGLFLIAFNTFAQDFQGEATYLSKSTMDLGRWGEKMTEAQKKQVKERLKNRLEKTYVLTFNKTESTFKEEEKIDALSGATDSWGKAFTPGEQYKNLKEENFVQEQDFYGKTFLVKDSLLTIDWKLSGETKKIGNYNCFKATASIPTSDLAWYKFSWSELRTAKKDTISGEEIEIPKTNITAWYTLQVPVSSGPFEFWGLPGLILEINDGETTLLCSKLTLNPEDKVEIEAPEKGKDINKTDYKATITKKMIEMRNNRGR